MVFQVTVAILGIWSEGVMGPGLRSMFWNAVLLVKNMSGEVVLFCLSRVGKPGSTCLHLSRSMSVFMMCPIGLLPTYPSVL